MPRTEITSGPWPNALRTSPIGIAIATFVALVCICTAFFFASARVVFDVDRHCFGTAFTPSGADALGLVMLVLVLLGSFFALAVCMNRCPTWWLGLLTLLCSITATLAVIVFPALMHFLPIGLITSATNSSGTWYLGALVQLVIALGLLKCFRKSKTRSQQP